VEARPRELEIYVAANGREPFQDWLNGLDAHIRAKVRIRLRRVEEGNLGNHHGVGEGVLEFIIDEGPGYRIYFGQAADRIILLTGGTKRTQESDIKTAKAFWSDWKNG
jgi:putative addiction module killer protein